jgi:serine/threonine protein kinase
MQSGEIVDARFELRMAAGAGSMGTVWQGFDRVTGEMVAVKILREVDDAAVRRFFHEARILSGLEHPHVVRYLAHGLGPQGIPYIAMEWLEGEDLAQRLARAALRPEESVDLVLRVAGALGAAHARGIIHRDIKPSNLFLVGMEPSRVKILDFGIARGDEVSTILTRSGTIMGTPGYMAPEQVRGSRDIGPRVDVFSLGCVLYECLTGKKAYEGLDIFSVLAKLVIEPPPALDALRPDLPAALRDLVQRMMAHEPAERPLDGADVAQAMAQIEGYGNASPPRYSLLSRAGERPAISPDDLPETVVDDASHEQQNVLPFVGRERDLRHLLGLVEAAFEESWSCPILIAAPSGMGKSRLRHELGIQLQERFPLVRILLGHAKPLFKGHDHSLLGSVLVGDTKPLAHVASDEMQNEFMKLAMNLVKTHPVLLVLEDLHWADAASVRIVDVALRDLSDKPFCVLACARSEVHDIHPKLWAGRKLQEVRLGGLPRRVVEPVVRGVLGPSTAPETVSTIVERADGNAAVLETLIRQAAKKQRMNNA